MEALGASALVGLGLVGIFTVLKAVFVFTLYRTLERCDPSVRALEPGLVWLLMIPVFEFFWIFRVVPAIADSLEREFGRRGVTVEPRPTRSLGLASAILWISSIVPLVQLLTGLPALVCWIVYWVKVAAYGSKLEPAPVAV